MNEPTGRRTRVAVVFGGRSSEHAISCVTAGSVLKALDRERYDVSVLALSGGPGVRRLEKTGVPVCVLDEMSDDARAMARQAHDDRPDATPILVPDPEVHARDVLCLQLPGRREVPKLTAVQRPSSAAVAVSSIPVLTKI